MNPQAVHGLTLPLGGLSVGIPVLRPPLGKKAQAHAFSGPVPALRLAARSRPVLMAPPAASAASLGRAGGSLAHRSFLIPEVHLRRGGAGDRTSAAQ